MSKRSASVREMTTKYKKQKICPEDVVLSQEAGYPLNELYPREGFDYQVLNAWEVACL